MPHPFVVFAKGWDGFDLLSESENLRKENFEFEIGNFRLKKRRKSQEKGAGKMPGGTKCERAKRGKGTTQKHPPLRRHREGRGTRKN
jgi:hypothetical protein